MANIPIIIIYIKSNDPSANNFKKMKIIRNITAPIIYLPCNDRLCLSTTLVIVFPTCLFI